MHPFSSANLSMLVLISQKSMHPKRINTLFFECGQQELTGLPPKR
jgi:hypothetical protein